LNSFVFSFKFTFLFLCLGCAGELRILGFEKKKREKKKRKNGSCCSFCSVSISWNYDLVEICPASIIKKKQKIDLLLLLPSSIKPTLIPFSFHQ